MARPTRNNADYFPHFGNMRNHKKVRALRNKFGLVLGYAFWSMILEWLTEQDGLEWELSEFELEMFSTELGVSASEIQDMISFCEKIGLLTVTHSNFLYSESLNENLQPVFDKRNKERDRSKTRQRAESGLFLPQNNHTRGVSAAETLVTAADSPQRKEKESKVEKRKEDTIKNCVVSKNRNLPSADADYTQNFKNSEGDNSGFAPKEKKEENPPSKVAPKVSPLKFDLKPGKNGVMICTVLREKVREFDKKHPGIYPPEMYAAFVTHWSEPTKNGKPAWYVEYSAPKGKFDVAKRLATWNKNNFNQKPINGNRANPGTNGSKLYSTSAKFSGEYGAGTVFNGLGETRPAADTVDPAGTKGGN